MELELKNGYHLCKESLEYLRLRTSLKKKNATLENGRGLKPNHENINIGTAYGLGAAGNGKHLWFPYGCLLIKVLIQL